NGTCYKGACSPNFKLTVTKVGTAAASGLVSSLDNAINCGLTCGASYAPGATVTLNAIPAKGSVFLGWSGACSGTNTCQITLGGDTVLNANFTSVVATRWDASWSVPGVTYSGGDLSISGNSVTHKNARTIDGKSSGKWYWENKATGGVAAANNGGIGILESAMPNNASYIGSVASGMSFGYAGG